MPKVILFDDKTKEKNRLLRRCLLRIQLDTSANAGEFLHFPKFQSNQHNAASESVYRCVTDQCAH
jgi:hypothetical protein